MRPLLYGTRLILTFFFLLTLSNCFFSRSQEVHAEEPCQAFLEALREERLFDVAIEYLDAMENSPLAPPEFRERIALHKVAVLLDEAGLIRDDARLTAQLDRTEKILTDYIKAEPRAVLLAEAQEQRARILMARAGRLLTQAKSDRMTVAQKTEKQEKARVCLEEASTAYGEIRQRLRSELKKKLDPQNPNANTDRERLRNKYVLVRLQSPKIKERIADSFGPDHPEYAKLLQQASVENLELYEKYRTRLSGIDGCLGAARCFVKLGQPDKAMGHLVDVFDLPRGSVQIAKKREAAVVAVDCWNLMDPFPLEEVFQRLRQVVYSMTPEFGRSSDGIKIQLAFAKACKDKVDKIKAEGGARDPETRKELTNLKKQANRILRSLSRIAGTHRDEARALLEAMGSSVAEAEVAENKGPPETMAEARKRGKEIQVRVGQLKIDLKQAEAAGDDSKIAALKQQIAADSQSALAMLELALKMTDDQSSADDLSNIRYLQCANYYQNDLYFEAAIIGEYVLENFPNNSGAAPSAGLVCNAYWNLYREEGKLAEGETPADRSFERERLVELCDLIFSTWPGSRQSEQAGLVMTLLSLAEGDLVEANDYLERVPANSPSRPPVVLEVGNRLWQMYVREKRRGETDAAGLAAMRDKAQSRLQDGIVSLDASTVSTYQARSVLALVELYLDAGETDMAIDMLENAPVAPLDLIKNKNKVAKDDKFRRDTYRTAVRGYLAKLRDAENALSWVEKSQAVLQALKNDIGDSPEGRKQLSDIYLTLARELKQQFESLGNNQQREAFADGLEAFLAALGKNAEDQNLMLLTGSMDLEIGQGLTENGLTDPAKRFFKQAVSIYSQLDKANETDPRIRLEIQRGLAKSLSGTGQYEAAIKTFADILSVGKNRQFIDLQIEAARVYADWGIAKGNSEALVKAIRGGEKRELANGKTVTAIMGWVNLAKAAQRSKKNAFLAEAVYNIAKCKFRYGQIKKQESMQQSAIDEVTRFKAKVPEMGGEPWKSRLDALLVRMQQEKG